MKMNKRNIHDNNCDCPICNNGIREEFQYGAMPVADGRFIILDVEELAHIEWYQNSEEYSKRVPPSYKRFAPEDDANPVLAYGVIISQSDTKITDWNAELQKHKEFGFGTLQDNQVFVSGYSDFVIYEDEKVYNTHIPCALLLHTSLDLSQEREYGFGYTSFLLFRDMDILSNILNRQYLFCLGGIEQSFDSKDLDRWKDYINKESLTNVAKRLF